MKQDEMLENTKRMCKKEELTDIWERAILNTDAFKFGAGEDSWESLGLPGDQASQSLRKSTLNSHWRDTCWSWSSNVLAIWHEETIH